MTNTRENARRRYARALSAAYAAADDDARAYGAGWYAAARAVAREIADECPCSLEQAAGAIAALSPRVSWADNQADARRLADWYFTPNGCGDWVPLWGLRLHAFSAQQHKAVDCLTDGMGPLDILRGPKERAFYRNIIGDTDAVTVDVWVARAATRGTRDKPASHRDYADMAAGLRRAARAAGVTPRDFQAAVWVAIRQSHS